jgi:alkyl hydroperoxide reductase subunit AhpC
LLFLVIAVVCPTEIIAFSDRYSEFEAIGCKVAAFSVDSHFSHLAWIQTPRSKGGLGKMAIPVIADVSKSLSKSLGCLIEDPKDGDNGVTVSTTCGSHSLALHCTFQTFSLIVSPRCITLRCFFSLLQLRATFIVDPSGNVRSVQMNDLPVGRSVDEVLRIVQAFQYVEKHGEVCPAGWKPGAATMKADPKGSQEYFAAVNKA